MIICISCRNDRRIDVTVAWIGIRCWIVAETCGGIIAIVGIKSDRAMAYQF